MTDGTGIAQDFVTQKMCFVGALELVLQHIFVCKYMGNMLY